MNKHFFKYLAGLAVSVVTLSVQAVPTLQLDIIGGVYDNSDETIVTSANQFSLVAYGGGSKFDLNDDYFISIALTPQIGPDLVDFGSFSFAGNTYDMYSMVYGSPPIENGAFLQPHDDGDLPPHGVFPTLFAEYQFNFSSLQTSASVNTQDVTGSDPTSNPGNALFYMLFNVDISNLFAGFDLHFDLYNTAVKRGGDIDVDDFAPFSHDAGTRDRTVAEVPEPAPLMLLGLGMLVLALVSRRRMMK
jgi:hypothetical protein